MQLNTSNLCFNYDDLLSVKSLALFSQPPSNNPAACVVLYIEFYCLHRQMMVWTSFIKLSRVSTTLIVGDDDGEHSSKDLAPFAAMVKAN